MAEIGEIDTSNIPQRKPVLGTEASPKFEAKDVDREWRLVTEAIKREVVQDQGIREVLVKFCAQPLSEGLVARALSQIADVNPRTQKLLSRFENSLVEYTALPEIPDHSFHPDLQHPIKWADPTKRYNEITESWKRYSDLDPESYDEYVKYDWDLAQKSGIFEGITKEEVFLVARRYKFARDIKILALGAEVVNTGASLNLDENGEATLPSGIKIKLSADDPSVKQDFLNFTSWERRTQVKDRVYEIIVGSRKYFLKERKTVRHTDTIKHGHQEGNTSAQEFDAAWKMYKDGKKDTGEVQVNWEKPIGYVEFPDGYQFCVFEHEDGLISSEKYKEINAGLVHKINDKPDVYKDEYHELLEKLRKTKVEPPRRSFFQRHNPFSKSSASQLPELSFWDFAKLKAEVLKENARELLQEISLTLGYVNRDVDGYSFRILDPGKVVLEIVGFDFEYYKKADPKYIAEIEERTKKFLTESRLNRPLNTSSWGIDAMPITDRQREAYKIMMGVV